MKVNFLKHPFFSFFLATVLEPCIRNLVIFFLKFWWSNILAISLQISKNTLQFFLQFLISNFSFFLFFFLKIYLGWGFIRNWVISGIQWMVCWWMLVHFGPKESEKHTQLAHTWTFGEWRINNSVQSGGCMGGELTPSNHVSHPTQTGP